RQRTGALAVEAPLLIGAAGLDPPLGLRLDADDRPVAGAGHDDDIGGGGRRGDDAEHAVVVLLGIEVADAPDFAAVLQAVRRGVVATEHDEVFVLAVAPEHRRGVGQDEYLVVLGCDYATAH